MLGKLIKLDLRFAYKKFLIMASLLLIFGLAMPYLGEGLLAVGAAVVFGVVMTVVPLMCIWLVVQHFQRNLFSSEGYLMFTLPVSAGELLLSKLVTTIVWFNLMLASAGGLVFLLARKQVSMAAVWAQLDRDVANRLLHIVSSINVNVIPMILAIFMGIACSTVAVRNKRLGIVWGIAIMLAGIAPFAWATTKLSGWIFLNLSANNSLMIEVLPSQSPWASLLISLVIATAFSALYFVITTRVMQHRLNLE